MIHNPQIGMRVKFIRQGSSRYRCMGQIIRILSTDVVEVNFDHPICGVQCWMCETRELMAFGRYSPNRRIPIQPINFAPLPTDQIARPKLGMRVKDHFGRKGTIISTVGRYGMDNSVLVKLDFTAQMKYYALASLRLIEQTPQMDEEQKRLQDQRRRELFADHYL